MPLSTILTTSVVSSVGYFAYDLNNMQCADVVMWLGKDNFKFDELCKLSMRWTRLAFYLFIFNYLMTMFPKKGQAEIISWHSIFKHKCQQFIDEFINYQWCEYYSPKCILDDILRVSSLQALTKQGEEHGEIDRSRGLIHHTLQVILSWIFAFNKKSVTNLTKS